MDDAGDPEQHGDGMELHDLSEQELRRGEDDVLVVDAAVAEKLECGPVIVDLPKDVGHGDKEQERDAKSGPAGEEHSALRGAEQTEAEGDEEEGHRGLVQEADAGGDAEDDPPLRGRAAAKDEDESEDAGHPEHGLAGVHGEEAVECDVAGGEEEGEHREELCGSAAAKSPGDEAAEEDHDGSGDGGEDADAED
jgi:hypothetical protein